MQAKRRENQGAGNGQGVLLPWLCYKRNNNKKNPIMGFWIDELLPIFNAEYSGEGSGGVHSLRWHQAAQHNVFTNLLNLTFRSHSNRSSTLLDRN